MRKLFFAPAARRRDPRNQVRPVLQTRHTLQQRILKFPLRVFVCLLFVLFAEDTLLARLARRFLENIPAAFQRRILVAFPGGVGGDLELAVAEGVEELPVARVVVDVGAVVDQKIHQVRTEEYQRAVERRVHGAGESQRQLVHPRVPHQVSQDLRVVPLDRGEQLVGEDPLLVLAQVLALQIRRAVLPAVPVEQTPQQTFAHVRRPLLRLRLFVPGEFEHPAKLVQGSFDGASDRLQLRVTCRALLPAPVLARQLGQRSRAFSAQLRDPLVEAMEHDHVLRLRLGIGVELLH
mmetsp:Transcript_59006/g.89013  ORF Transcript_59006/g.89013 Transcript_59006/m.89013 type:complete len:292 (-) Transcript_59006:1418-2293(-)